MHHIRDVSVKYVIEGVCERCGCHTSLGFGEALMQAEDNLIYKVLDVAVLWPSDEHHPVVGEALWCDFLSQLSSMAQFQFHLHCALETWEQKLLSMLGPFDLVGNVQEVQGQEEKKKTLRIEKDAPNQTMAHILDTFWTI